jgi:hypothetical protein
MVLSMALSISGGLMESIKDHPKWDEFVMVTSNLTGYYEDEDYLYIAEEAHRGDGSLQKIKKSDLAKRLGTLEDDWEEMLDDDSLFNDLERIY